MSHVLIILRGIVTVMYIVVGIAIYLNFRDLSSRAYRYSSQFTWQWLEYRWYAKLVFAVCTGVIMLTLLLNRAGNVWWYVGCAVIFILCLSRVALRHTNAHQLLPQRYLVYLLGIFYVGTFITGMALLFPDAAQQALAVANFIRLALAQLLSVAWEWVRAVW